MVFGAENKEGKRFFGNTLREAQEKARASEQVFINEKFTPQNEPVKEVVKPKVEQPKVEEKELLTKTEIKARLAKEQRDWLKERGITPARYEDDRVEQIYRKMRR